MFKILCFNCYNYEDKVVWDIVLLTSEYLLAFWRTVLPPSPRSCPLLLCFDPEDGGTSVFWNISAIYQWTWPNTPEDWVFNNIALWTPTLAYYNCVKVTVIVFWNGVSIWLKYSHQLRKGEVLYGGELNITINYVRNIFICEWLHAWLDTKL